MSSLPAQKQLERTSVTTLLSAGPQLSLPQNTTTEQLETLLNGLLNEDAQRLPYLFYVQDSPLGESLVEHLLKHQATVWALQHAHRAADPVHNAAAVLQVSVETALGVVYQPQAVFRVRPVTRCTASLAGEACACRLSWSILQFALECHASAVLCCCRPRGSGTLCQLQP